MRYRLLSTGDKIEFHDNIPAEEVGLGTSERVYVSQVFDFNDNGNINVAMPISKGQLIPLSKGKKFNAFFYTSKGIYQCRCQIVDRTKVDNIYSMEIALLTELQKYQRRQYFRLEKTIPVRYTELSDEDYMSILETHHFPDHLKDISIYTDANSMDISGGGMRFVGKQRVEAGKKVLVIFEVTEKGNIKMFRLPATVIAAVTPSGRNGRTGICELRVEFENITREYRELLIRYIFEEERKKRRLDLI